MIDGCSSLASLTGCSSAAKSCEMMPHLMVEDMIDLLLRVGGRGTEKAKEGGGSRAKDACTLCGCTDVTDTRPGSVNRIGWRKAGAAGGGGALS